MIKDITLGQFFPGESVIHKLDPRMKLILTVFFAVVLFSATNFSGLAVSFVLTALGIILSKINFKLILKSLKPLLFVLAFTTFFNIFYATGTPIFVFYFISITWEGLRLAAFSITRIVILIAGTSLLTYTTSPTMLTDAIERLLSPLNKIKVPVHDFAMTMTIALRFIPTIIEETDKIMSAQKARGAKLESGGLIARAKAMLPVLIPLFVSAFRRANELATAMICRCYVGGEGRTRLKQYKYARRDFFAVALFAISIIIVIIANIINIL